MDLRSRYVNAQVTELIHRLGIHQWRLAEEEKYFLHRYLYDSVLHGLKVLGINVENQDPLIPTTAQPEFVRVPKMPQVIKADDILDQITEVVSTNGQGTRMEKMR